MGGFSSPPGPPRAQPHLWQGTAGWRSLLLPSPVGRWSHRPPSVVALVGGDVATLTPPNPKPGAPPPQEPRALGGGSIPFRASAGIRGATPAPQPSVSGPEASAHPPPPRVVHGTASRATHDDPGLRGCARASSPSSSTFLRVFQIHQSEQASLRDPELSMHQTLHTHSRTDPSHIIRHILWGQRM